MKRLFDIVCSLLALVILLVPFLLIALLIKLDSDGPVFYLQERIGRGGSGFQLFKLRTMRVGADKGQVITVGERDARITRIGYFLRKFKLDELPQLINVLKGEMSLVGPRPELRKFTDLYTDEQRKVLSIRPGITDLASIRFRNENELLEGKADPIDFYVREILPVKLAMNLEYVNNQSVWKDIRILFLTAVHVFIK